MKKALLSLSVILVFIFYSLHQRLEGSDQSSVVAPQSLSSSAPVMDSNPVAGSPPPPSNQNPLQFLQPPAANSGQYKNGQFTGDVTDAYYGNVQVKAIISGGKITDVQFLQYPNDRRTSVEINSQAIPYLQQEAIQAQNANVDIVSGATQTSRAFKGSLQSALDQAKI